MEHHSLTKDQLVELLDQYSDVYPLSPTGARGWVRAKRDLPKTDPEIYIDWDKNHWRYHGERDGWTFEHHFRPVQDEGLDIHQESTMPNMESILAEAHRQVDAGRCPSCSEFHDQPSDFIDTLLEANDAALGSDAYIVISVKGRQDGNYAVYEPEVFTAFLTESARKTLAIQLITIASQIFETHTVGQIQRLEGRDEPDRP